MSPRWRSATGDAEDLAKAPFLDDEERAEFEWLLARDKDPATPAPSSEIASDYRRIGDLLASMPAGRYVPGWQEEVLRKAATLTVPWWRRPMFRWTAGGATALAAATAALLILIRRPAPELEVAIRHGNQARSSDDAVLGDHLIITARPRGLGDLRVFGSNSKLVASCPRGPGCMISTAGAYTLELALGAPATYHVILVVGLSNAPEGGTMDAYLDAASAANARIVAYPPIDVR